MYFVKLKCKIYREKPKTMLLVSEDDDEDDQGVHVSMPEDDMRRASDTAVISLTITITVTKMNRQRYG